MVALTRSVLPDTPAQSVSVEAFCDGFRGRTNLRSVGEHTPVDAFRVTLFTPVPSVHESETTPAAATFGGFRLANCGHMVGATPFRLVTDKGTTPEPFNIRAGPSLPIPYATQSTLPASPPRTVNASGALNAPQATLPSARHAPPAGPSAGASAAQRKPIVPARSYRSSIRKYFWCSPKKFGVSGKYHFDPAGR